jgi:hypothetical protein
MKQSRALALVRVLYKLTERVMGPMGITDNLTLVLEKRAGSGR